MFVVKQCTKCGEYKLLEEYYSQKNKPFGKRLTCKSCHKEYNKENKERIKQYSKQYREENKERILQQNKQYREENKERIKQYNKQYHQENKECILQQKKQYHQENKECRAKYSKQYHQENRERLAQQKKQYNQENKECRKQWQRQYQEENKERIKQYSKQYREENKERIKQYNQENREHRNQWQRQYQKQRKKTDAVYKMRINMSKLIYKSIKNQGYTKKSQTYNILGCDFDTFKKHIEKQFTKGMNWQNQGEWHFDHIIPIATAKTEEDVIRLNHYTNFQPLWAKDNLSKGAKIKPTQLKMVI
jgi:hypothetical protein